MLKAQKRWSFWFWYIVALTGISGKFNGGWCWNLWIWPRGVKLPSIISCILHKSCYVTSTYFIIRFVCQTFCRDEELRSWLLANEGLTRKDCDALLKDLKKEHLDPVLERLYRQGKAEVSFHDIIQGYERIKQGYEARATGAEDVCATIFFEFHLVNEIFNTWCYYY